MKIKVNDKVFGDMVFDIDCDDRKHLRVLRNKAITDKSYAQDNPNQPLYIIHFLEEGEYGKNWDDDDWRCEWPVYVGFVTRVRGSADFSGDGVKEGWDWSDFDVDDDAKVDDINAGLQNCLGPLIKDSGLARPDNLCYIAAPDEVQEEKFNRALRENANNGIMFYKRTLEFGIDRADKVNDDVMFFAPVNATLEHIRSLLDWHVVSDDPPRFVKAEEAGTYDFSVTHFLTHEFSDIYAAFMLRGDDEKAKVLQEMVKLPVPGSPYAELPEYAIAHLDLYRHSGDAWSYAGCGMQCRWDTSHDAGILYFDPDFLKECLKVTPEDEVRKGVKADFDIALHLLSEDVPDAVRELTVYADGKVVDNHEEYGECYTHIFYDSYDERDRLFNDIAGDTEAFAGVEFEVLED